MTTRTTCPYCGVGCGILAAGSEPVTPDAAHPANLGRICSKGAALAETLVDGDRLVMARVDGRSMAVEAALDHLADRFAATIAAHGPESVAFYGSGQFLTEDYYVANKLIKGFVGTANIDTNSRLCMASTVAGHKRAFGADVVPGIYADLDEADLAVMVGSNAAWCHPVLHQRLLAARSRRGTKLVAIDPRRTATADQADLVLGLAPGSDIALFAGLLVHLDERGAINRDWMQRHTQGLDEALTMARDGAGSLAAVAAATELPADRLATFYDWFAETERVVTLFSQGVNQSRHGTDKVGAILNVHLASGRIGRPGMGPFSLTGQPNAMGGREVGGLATMLAAHMDFTPADRDRVARFWGVARVAETPGPEAVDLFEAVADGRIKAIWIAGTNPAVSMPRAGAVRQALARCPLVVVSDCWEADTTRLAHVVLPAEGRGEKDGTVTNSERCISRQRRFRAPPGEARADWRLFAGLGQRLGHGATFAWSSPAEVFAEHAAVSAFENAGARVFNIGGLADLDAAAYDAMAPVRWPYPAGASVEGGRLFADGRFPTPDGRARIDRHAAARPLAWRHAHPGRGDAALGALVAYPAGPRLDDAADRTDPLPPDPSLLLPLPTGAETVGLSDPVRGVLRLAALLDGQLIGALAIAPERAELPPTDWLAAMLGTLVPDSSRLALCAGRPPEGASAGGDVLCACFGVTGASLRRTIGADRLATAEAVGHATRAGTNCRSCVPEIAELLRDVHEPA